MTIQQEVKTTEQIQLLKSIDRHLAMIDNLFVLWTGLAIIAVIIAVGFILTG